MMRRGRSSSPGRTVPNGRGRSSSPSRGMHPPPRGRSSSPSRGMNPLPQRGRSSSPSRGMHPLPPRGRSNSPSRTTVPLRGRSNSPSARMARGRSGSPSNRMQRGRSSSPSNRLRGRSSSPSGRLRGRSSSPSGRMRGKSASPSGRLRGRSSSPSGRLRGRSSSPSGRGRSRSSSPGRSLRNSRFQSFRRGGKRPTLDPNDPNQKSILRIGGISAPESCNNKEFCRKIICYLMPVCLLLVSSAGLIVATGNAARFTPDWIQNFIPAFNNDDIQDPFAGSAGVANETQWYTNGEKHGLILDYLNALEDSWQTTFNLAFTDWDYGNPDAVTLSSSKVEYEIDCKAVAGKVKVCNGDYGETKWRGINEATLDNGYITACSVRMNEYYLRNEQENVRQYTMCHELGHSLGLPHTDEDFNNADLGNCLDYTNNFDVSLHPGEMNYVKLLDLYGPVGATRKIRSLPALSSNGKSIPESVLSKMKEAVAKLAMRMDDNAHEDGWRVLHRSKFGEEHELELERGFSVRVHMLLA